MQKIVGILFFFIAVGAISCKSKDTLFTKIDSSRSGIKFRNEIIENDSMNILDLENIYNGGGVGIADFNNDGLPDIYFTGNMVSNKLYLNEGKLKFKDITEAAGVGGEGKWARGVSIVDINNDGWQDIYISETILKDSLKRENILYVNQGLDKEGLPIFKNLAKEYGLNDNSHTTQAAFFDYDNDGDLDVYLAVNVFAQKDNPNNYRRKFINGEHPNTDRLYRNDWDPVKKHPVFTNVSRQAGILQEGFAHSVTVCDINLDGWKDVFVANDYLSEDLLWINNKNGTFTNHSKEYFKHTSYNAMGADVVDINNDGLSDVIELDMNPEDNYRKKTMLGPGKYQTYLYNNSYGYQYQYIRNCLHLNMGVGKEAADSLAHPLFGDIGFYSGVAETDWSWTPLVADFDRDGFRDMIITNGFPKDITDHDFMIYRNSTFAMNAKSEVLKQIPEVKISNYAFRNNGNLKFANLTKEWGLDEATFSNGASWSDLDNDGDLDVVINNINDEAMVYENNQAKKKKDHFLKIKLKGKDFNTGAFGSWIKLYYGKGQEQVYETNPVRGYLSSIENIPFFGLGDHNKIDSLIVIWPDNSMSKLLDVKVDQEIIINQSAANLVYSWETQTVPAKWFNDVVDSLRLNYMHQQKDVNDFAIQPLLPHKLSNYGPYMTSGDINKDGKEDFIIGSANGKPETIFFQLQNGEFKRQNLFNSAIGKELSVSDMGLQLFDADKDGDLDLYIARGGYEEKAGSVNYQDEFYINDGKGNFRIDTNALPVNYTSKSCVRTADYDNDGDEDIFVGGRVEPWHYPKAVSSIILRNDSGNGKIKFTDITKDVAPSLLNIGLVCDAVWADYNKDGWQDLIVAGEWMPITFLENNRGKLVNATANTGIANNTGWWNCITPGDFDNDGDIDFVAGNVGGNSFFSNDSVHPLKSYYHDFDKNGIFENITTKYLKDKEGAYREFTMQNRDDIIDQLPVLKKSFLSYKSFAEAQFSTLFKEEQVKESYQRAANYFSTSVIKNLGNGRFEILPLPVQAQLSSVFNTLVADYNADGNADMLLCGNDNGAEVFNGKLDAMNGLLLLGNGQCGFRFLSMKESGICIPGDAKSLISIKTNRYQSLIICSQHNGRLKAFAKK